MEWLSKRSKQMLLEMSAVVILYDLILGILAWRLLPSIPYPVIPVLKGLAAGGIGAIVMLVHIAVMSERVIGSQNEAYANKTTVLHSMIRKLVFIATLFFCWHFLQVDLLATVFGAMGMKAGAYLQPVVDKFFFHKKAET